MQKQTKFATLDVMRGLAAIAVMALHLNFTPGVPGRMSSAHLSVDLFFIISGFVIAHAYSERLTAGMSWTEFMLVRLVRLYPLYLAGLALGLLWRISALALHQPAAMTAVDIGRAAILGLAFLPAPSNGASTDAWPLNPVFWSLFFEIIVNLGAALVWRRLTGLALGLIVLLGATALSAVAMTLGSLQHGYQFHELWAGLARATFSFFAGVAIFRLGERAMAPKLPPIVAVALIAAILLCPVSHGVRAAFDLAAVLIAFPLLVAAARNNPGPIMTRLFGALGAASYAIYTLHRPLIGVADVFKDALALPRPLYAMGFMVMVIVGSIVVDRVYDLPARRWLKAHLDTERGALARTPRSSRTR